MKSFFVAKATFICMGFFSFHAQAAEVISLQDAFSRVEKSHPDLQVFRARQTQMDAGYNLASLKPALHLGASLENAMGSGDHSGLKAAELSLSLSSLFERGEKLAARQQLAQTQIAALTTEQQITHLDLMAEVARRYLSAVSVQLWQAIMADDLLLRETAVAIAQKQFKAGAVPESVLLAAQVALEKTHIEQRKLAMLQKTSKQYLAALWNQNNEHFEIEAADLGLPEVEALAELVQRLDSTPEITQFASETRIAEARLQLARSESSSDLSWQIGLRRLEASNDFALLAGVSIALGSKQRAAPQIQSNQAQILALEIKRESKQQSLYATLLDAHARYAAAREEAAGLRQYLLPTLIKAEAIAKRAFQAGATTYLEWSSLQNEIAQTRKQKLSAALDASRALIEIQRLTAQPIVLNSTARTEQGQKP